MTLKNFFSTITILLLVVLVNNYFLDNFLQNIVHRFWRWPGSWLTEGLIKISGPGHDFLDHWFKVSNLLEKNLGLEKENKILLSQIVELNRLKHENKLLKDQLGADLGSKDRLVLAKIISINRDFSGSTILIDKGLADGLKEKMAITSGSNVLAGVTSRVFNHSAEVYLLDNQNLKVSVHVGKEQLPAITKGKASLLDSNPNHQAVFIFLDLITSQDQVSQGDLVVTNGWDGLPDGFLVGRVEKIKTETGKLFKRVWIRPFFDRFLIPTVLVLIPE